MDILLEQGWSEIDSTLVKNFQLKNFSSAIEFVNQIAGIANAMDHHPDIFIYSYKNVRVILTTHSEGRITSKDIEQAKKIDAIFTT
ncbi:MAG: 4a-hydroxytetrahydrobiopterin dehydratase [Marinifilaceae bacterium]